MGPIIIIMLMVGLAVWAAASFARHRRAWAELAREHGLQLQGSYFGPVLVGRYGGHTIQVGLDRRRQFGRRSDDTFTQYRVTIGAPMPSGFSVRKEGLLHQLGKVIGIHDIRVGDSELDEALSIKGNDMVGIIRLFGIPEVGAAVLGMVIAYPDIEIGQSIAVEESGMAEAERIETMLGDLCDLARALEAGYQRLAAEHGGSPWTV
jgi:hypothetical protein